MPILPAEKSEQTNDHRSLIKLNEAQKLVFTTSLHEAILAIREAIFIDDQAVFQQIISQVSALLKLTSALSSSQLPTLLQEERRRIASTDPTKDFWLNLIDQNGRVGEIERFFTTATSTPLKKELLIRLSQTTQGVILVPLYLLLAMKVRNSPKQEGALHKVIALIEKMPGPGMFAPAPEILQLADEALPPIIKEPVPISKKGPTPTKLVPVKTTKQITLRLAYRSETVIDLICKVNRNSYLTRITVGETTCALAPREYNYDSMPPCDLVSLNTLVQWLFQPTEASLRLAIHRLAALLFESARDVALHQAVLYQLLSQKADKDLQKLVGVCRDVGARWGNGTSADTEHTARELMGVWIRLKITPYVIYTRDSRPEYLKLYWQLHAARLFTPLLQTTPLAATQVFSAVVRLIVEFTKGYRLVEPFALPIDQLAQKKIRDLQDLLITFAQIEKWQFIKPFIEKLGLQMVEAALECAQIEADLLQELCEEIGKTHGEVNSPLQCLVLAIVSHKLARLQPTAYLHLPAVQYIHCIAALRQVTSQREKIPTLYRQGSLEQWPTFIPLLEAFLFQGTKERYVEEITRMVEPIRGGSDLELRILAHMHNAQVVVHSLKQDASSQPIRQTINPQGKQMIYLGYDDQHYCLTDPEGATVPNATVKSDVHSLFRAFYAALNYDPEKVEPRELEEKELGWIRKRLAEHLKRQTPQLIVDSFINLEAWLSDPFFQPIMKPSSPTPASLTPTAPPPIPRTTPIIAIPQVPLTAVILDPLTKEYIDAMTIGNMYGGGPEIEALEDIYKICIHIYEEGTTPGSLVAKRIPVPDDRPVVKIRYNGHDHYDALTPTMQVIKVPPNGHCFFEALIQSAGRAGVRSLAGLTYQALRANLPRWPAYQHRINTLLKDLLTLPEEGARAHIEMALPPSTLRDKIWQLRAQTTYISPASSGMENPLPLTPEVDSPWTRATKPSLPPSSESLASSTAHRTGVTYAMMLGRLTPGIGDDHPVMARQLEELEKAVDEALTPPSPKPQGPMYG